MAFTSEPRVQPGRSTASNHTESNNMPSEPQSIGHADIALPEPDTSVHAAAPVDKLDFNFWSNVNATLDAFDSSTQTSNNEGPLDTMSDVSIEEAPRIIQMFLSHGNACTKIEGEALELVSLEPTGEDEPLRLYMDMLDYLELLQEKAALLESAINRLVCQAEEQQTASDELDKSNDELVISKAAANANLRRVFAACLSVLRARKENLTVAQDLVDSAQENISISLRMEYLDIN